MNTYLFEVSKEVDVTLTSQRWLLASGVDAQRPCSPLVGNRGVNGFRDQIIFIPSARLSLSIVPDPSTFSKQVDPSFGVLCKVSVSAKDQPR